MFPSRLRKLALAASLPHSKHTPLRSLQRVGRLVGPRALAVLYRTWSTWEAVPQYISGRTSYLQVRLAFHSYTQLIRDCFSRHRFGPPLPFTGVSTWSCVAHLVSSLAPRTLAPYSDSLSLRLRLVDLSLHVRSKSPAHASIGTPPRSYGAMIACKSTVSGSLSLPFRGSFHRSLTVLFAIGHWEYLALRGGPRGFSHRFTNNDLLRCHHSQPPFHLQDCHLLRCRFPTASVKEVES